MEINLPNAVLDTVLSATKSPALKKAKESIRLRSGKFTTVDSNTLERETLKALYEEVKDTDREYASSIVFLWKAAKNPSKTKIKKYADIEPALKAYLASGGIRNYVFGRGVFKAVKAYLVTDVTVHSSHNRYSRASRSSPPAVNVSLAYCTSDLQQQTKTLLFGVDTLAGIFADANIEHEEIIQTFKYPRQNRDESDEERTYDVHLDTVSEVGISVEHLLSHYDLFLESEELHEAYTKQFDRFFNYVKSYGAQFRVRGYGERIRSGGWGWSSAEENMMTEGRIGRAIMNTVPPCIFPESEEERGKEKQNSYSFRRRGSSDDAGDLLPQSPSEVKAMFDALSIDQFQLLTSASFGHTEPTEVEVPMHPTLQIYHLGHMNDFTVHVNCLAPYKYAADIEDNLILPEGMKEMTRMMVVGSANVVEDIVAEKSQSTVIACVGDPGLGKTLLAEVMSEACEKPLYKIQAAQLGLDAENLERTLRDVLMRAQRWNAVLMIDEANAYIHSRGNDLNQNAIVGVFLRLIEYFRGILILTTNMTGKGDDVGYDIDDAILQRCAAVFKFEIPTRKAAIAIWKTQAKIQKVDPEQLTDELINELVGKYRLSGRSIRSLLRQTVAWASFNEKPLSMKLFDQYYQVMPKTRSEGLVVKETT